MDRTAPPLRCDAGSSPAWVLKGVTGGQGSRTTGLLPAAGLYGNAQTLQKKV